MTTICYSITIFLFSFLVHLLAWRSGLCKKNFINLSAILFGAVVITALSVERLAGPFSGLDLPRALLLAQGLAMAYIASYPALHAESPSLLIVTKIHNHQQGGVDEQDLLNSFDNQKLLEPRLEDLVTSKLAERGEDGRYRITAKGEKLVRIFIVFRSLMGAGKGG